MKISFQAKTIADALQKWLNEEQGKAVVVPDLLKLWEVAYQRTDCPRALVCYKGETIRGDFSVAAALGRVDREWMVAIIRGQNWAPKRGTGLTDTLVNGPAFYDQIEEGRDVIRCLRDISVELPVDFKRIYPMEKLDDFISGYIVEFSTAVDLPTMEVEVPVVNTGNLTLSFTTQPTDTFIETPIAPPVVVSVLDSSNSVVTAFQGEVILSLETNPPGSELSGTLTANIIDGQATFSDLTLNLEGSYSLRASCSILAPAISDTFNVSEVSLASLRVTLPCNPNTEGICPCESQSEQSAVLSGVPGVTYNIEVLFRGVVEFQPYTGGTLQGDGLYKGGIPSTEAYNVYSIEVSAPPAIYYANYGLLDDLSIVDFTANIQATAGATITLKALSQDDEEIANNGLLEAPGVTNLVPNMGQFIQLDAQSFTPV